MFTSIDGKIVAQREAVVPISDRGFLFGDGAFATIRVENAAPLFLQQHLEKLRAQCEALHIAFSLPSEQHIAELIHENRAQKGVWRLKVLVSGGDDPALLLPKRQGRVVITLTPYVEREQHPLNLCVYSQSIPSGKTLAYLPRLLARQEAVERGFDDCVTLSVEGYVLETTFGNLFWIVGNTLYTPSPTLPLHFGVTLESECKKATEKGFSVAFVSVTLDELPQIALFRTNAMSGVCPIKTISLHQIR